jgi:ubiquinol-cytochrome c reductase cytochrome c1 subunit
MFSMSPLKTSLFLAGAGVLALAGLSFAADAPAQPAPAAADEPNPPPARLAWSFAGAFGTFDRAQLQRGFEVYKVVCSGCHRLSIPFRALQDPDGPGYSEGQIKALAASYQVADDEPNAKGEVVKRQGRPSDNFPPPDAYPNDVAAVATFGKAPPDMWVLAKARKYERGFPWFIFDAIPGFQYQEMGADYIYGILNGYTKPDDAQWNLYYPGHTIAMPAPLSDGLVAYKDGTAPTLQNYAKDISAFLFWVSDPTMVERKKTGLRVMVFLIGLAIALYFTKKRIWADAH